MLEITEIIRRSEQGVTRPFLCKASDGNLYFAKGKGVGRQGLVAEFVAANLGKMILSLPIPDFDVAYVPHDIVEFSAIDDVSDLGEGPVFVSQYVDGVREFGIEHKDHVNEDLAGRIVLFDWWVQNEDRILTEVSRNCNLLWSVEDKQCWVFDHNLAFDNEFSDNEFWRGHIFRDSWNANDMRTLLPELTQGIQELPEIWNRLPNEWHYLDDDMTIPSSIKIEDFSKVLRRPLDFPATFWRAV